MLDISSTGSGKWLSFGPLSLRMVLLGSCILLSIPGMVQNIKGLMRNPYVLMVLAFVAMLFINAVRGYLGDSYRSILMSDLKGFSYYAMLPALLVFLTNQKRIEWVMRSVILGSGLLALFSILCVLTYEWPVMQQLLEYAYNSTIIYANPISHTIIRVFQVSNLYFICASIFCFYFFLKRKKTGWGYIVITALCLAAMMLSITRSSYLAIGVAIVVILVAAFMMTEINKKKIWIFLGGALLGFILILAALYALTGGKYLSFVVQRTLISYFPEKVETDVPQDTTWYLEQTVASDDLRNETLEELSLKISQSPILGKGLGAYVQCRESGETEYFFLNLIHKTGLLGLGIYLSPLIYMFYTLIVRWRRRTETTRDLYLIKLMMFGCLLGFMSASYFQPYMNAALGVTMYCLAMAVAAIKEGPQNSEMGTKIL